MTRRAEQLLTLLFLICLLASVYEKLGRQGAVLVGLLAALIFAIPRIAGAMPTPRPRIRINGRWEDR